MSQDLEGFPLHKIKSLTNQGKILNLRLHEEEAQKTLALFEELAQYNE